MIHTIEVKTGKPYLIHIGKGLLHTAGQEMTKVLCPCRVCAVADSTTASLYGEILMQSLKSAGYEPFLFVFPAGEKSKNLAVFGQILEFQASCQISRSDCFIALGGGVVGDITGFAAASFLRGVRFVQIPTTLLAMADSSVGGKTGVNLKSGKNLAGAFHQPSFVLCDTALTDTLPPEAVQDGAAEAIKAGMLADGDLFRKLSAGNWYSQREDVIARCIDIKRDIVEKDEFDRGERQKLNLGHTVGHAIEKYSGYQISHGHAVAMGMYCVTKAAVKAGMASADIPAQLADALRNNGLPVNLPMPLETLLPLMVSDKKISGGKLTLIVPESIGSCRLLPMQVQEAFDFLKQGDAL